MKQVDKAEACLAMDIDFAKRFMACGHADPSIPALANQLQTLMQLRQYCGRLMKEYDAGFVLIVFQEKAALIPDLRTQKDTQDFWKKSVPRYNFCKYVPQSHFHSNAEELLFWLYLSSVRPLKHDEYLHTESLFVRYFGSDIINDDT